MSDPSKAAVLEARQRKHVLFTWTAQESARPHSIAGGEGAWFFDHDGQRWLDLESQVFNCNAGHGQKDIIAAMKAQIERCPVSHPAGVFEVKAALGEALASITPGDLNHFFFTGGGAEANENAMKIARLVTGRNKFIARRRCYHGATFGALSLTGDRRRHAMEPTLWGVARTEDPYCYRCPFGLKPDGCNTQCASHLEHVIQQEGADTIAAVFMEGVTGASGGFIPPSDYWPKVREICDKYGVLLVSDEVMSGFGRTGQWFAVDHWNVVPDMITMAKGLTGGYAPMGAVAMGPKIAARFESETLWCGLTAYGHPVSCAAALGAIGVYQSQRLIERAADLEPHLKALLMGLSDRHPQVGDVRVIGLLGTIELVTNRDTRAPLNAGSAAGQRLKAALKARRLHINFRNNTIFVTPPLVIEAADLTLGVDLIDEAMTEARLGA